MTLCENQNKISFSTKKQVKSMISYLKKKFKTKQKCYLCPECKNYHLTSKL